MKVIPTFKALLKIAAKKEIRYFLNGIHVLERNGKVFIEATDGNVLVRLETVNGEFLQVAPDSNVILCRESLTYACASYGRISPQPLLKIEPDTVTISDGGRHFNINVIEGRFPDCDRVIPNDKNYSRDTYTKGFDVAKLSKLCKCVEDVLKVNGAKNFQGGRFDLFTPSDAMVITQSISDVKLTAVIMPCRLDGVITNE